MRFHINRGDDYQRVKNSLVCGIMDTVTRVQILDETTCNSYSVNTLGKSMNPISLLPLTGNKIVGQTCLFNLGMVTGLREKKTTS